VLDLQSGLCPLAAALYLALAEACSRRRACSGWLSLKMGEMDSDETEAWHVSLPRARDHYRDHGPSAVIQSARQQN
jgi:hypothetical protein